MDPWEEFALANTAYELIQPDKVRDRKIREAQESFKESMSKLRGLSYVEFSQPAKQDQQSDARTMLANNVELGDKIKTAIEDITALHQKIAEQHGEGCSGPCECLRLLVGLENNHEKLLEALRKSYSRVGRLARRLYGRGQ